VKTAVNLIVAPWNFSLRVCYLPPKPLSVFTKKKVNVGDLLVLTPDCSPTFFSFQAPTWLAGSQFGPCSWTCWADARALVSPLSPLPILLSSADSPQPSSISPPSAKRSVSSGFQFVADSILASSQVLTFVSGHLNARSGDAGFCLSVVCVSPIPARSFVAHLCFRLGFRPLKLFQIQL
jgi:hypothetical protein